ncbi:ANR family transcriptional regulator [Serratia marcescens]|uniref:ANR family transcriptional regulator n=1 Tax=Serratia marcescens TaxID=615 RepID=UPI0018D4E216|nr:ANR family transcriptional regulator [Serratia marcescens]
MMKDGVREEGAEVDGVLPGLHVMSTPRERLCATLRRAAELEREGCFGDAARYWLAGQALAVMESERLWCEARASLCQKKGGSDDPAAGRY